MPAWHPHPSVWLVLGGIWVAYLVAVRRHRRVAGEPPDRRRRTTLFSVGMACLWLGADWPVHDLAEGYLYSVHMAQHLVLKPVVWSLVTVQIIVITNNTQAIADAYPIRKSWNPCWYR